VRATVPVVLRETESDDVMAGVATDRAMRHATVASGSPWVSPAIVEGPARLTADAPLVSPATATNPSSVASGSVGAVPPAPVILVVDDMDSARALLHRRLARLIPTARILEAGDGLAALAIVAQETSEGRPGVDAVCIDGTMPLMSGYEAVPLLRERGYRGLILGITGNALGEDVARFAACGCDVVLTKPVVAAALRAALLLRLEASLFGFDEADAEL